MIKKIKVIDPEKIRPAGWHPELTEEQKEYVNTFLDTQKGAPLASLPVICLWHNCLYKKACALYELEISPTPEGKRCPIEIQMIERWLSQFSEELGIEEGDISDMAVLKTLIQWMIFEWRAQAELANDPKINRSSIVGIDKDGDPIVREIMNPAITMLEKAAKTKHKLWEALIATREAKAKDKSRKQIQISDIAAALQAKIEARKKEIEALEKNPLQLPPPEVEGVENAG